MLELCPYQSLYSSPWRTHKFADRHNINTYSLAPESRHIHRFSRGSLALDDYSETTMSPAKSDGQIWIEKAEKKANSSPGLFGSESAIYGEAAELYRRAGSEFKSGISMLDAGTAFAREAECWEKCGERFDAASAWRHAANAYRQVDELELAINAFGEAIANLTKAGLFRQAADRERDIAHIYLQRGDLPRACERFEQAGDWYRQEDSNALANRCFIDAADLYAQIDQYSAAVARYEQVSDQLLQSTLSKFLAREYWFRSGLCALANTDLTTVKRNLGRHELLDPGFSSTQDAKFLKALVGAVESGDSVAFATVCRSYDEHVVSLDGWRIAILLKIKQTIDEEPGLT